MNKYFLSLIFFILSAAPCPAQNTKIINQNKAVDLAERFVAANGYTNRTKIEKKNLFLESGERISDINKILAARFDSIQSEPVVALIKNVNGRAVWSVRFLFTVQDYDKQEFDKSGSKYDFGREVKVSTDGTRVWIERQPIAVQQARIYGDCVGEEN